MRKVFRSLWFGMVLLMIAACATPGTSTYSYREPENDAEVQNVVNIAESFDAVWDRLVERLATGFFVINNIDKASRLINVSFSSDEPQSYVDCGTTKRSYEFRAESEQYEYEVASDSTYKRAETWGPMNNLPLKLEVVRNAHLEGRINIYVAPLSNSETKVSANTKYVVQVSISGTAHAYNAFGEIVNVQPITASSSQASFTTNQASTQSWGSGSAAEPVTCRSTGELERSILRMAKAR